jgi:hypothetical protein
LLARLAKLSSVSKVLRVEVEKRANLLGMAGKGLTRAAGKAGVGALGLAAKGIGTAMKHPLPVIGAVATGATALGKAREYSAGFQPEVQQRMLGQSPVPPGVVR